MLSWFSTPTKFLSWNKDSCNNRRFGYHIFWCRETSMKLVFKMISELRYIRQINVKTSFKDICLFQPVFAEGNTEFKRQNFSEGKYLNYKRKPEALSFPCQSNIKLIE